VVVKRRRRNMRRGLDGVNGERRAVFKLLHAQHILQPEKKRNITSALLINNASLFRASLTVCLFPGACAAQRRAAAGRRRSSPRVRGMTLA